MRPTGNRSVFLLLTCWIVLAMVGCSRNKAEPFATETSPNHVAAETGPDVASGSSLEPAPAVATAFVSKLNNYVGSDSCVSCHRKRHESYLHSHHARSLTKVNVADEVAGAKLEHPASHRAYEIVRRDGKLWHREVILEPAGASESADPLVIAEFPIEYVMGSGKFAKGYLISDGGFLLQSPVTWYTSAKAYGMSPGYDTPANAGFGRAITDECVYCHSGMISTRDANPNFFTLDELAIGCERCHGPGRTHVEHYEGISGGGGDAGDTYRETIVHPGKLTREQSESLCGQCHCQGESQVSVAGKRDWDFRPGGDFARIKMNYDAVIGDQSSKRFVGHFPQLHESMCYQGSDTMTCVTCHDPHHHAEGEERHQLQRQQCLQCHGDDACGVPLDERVERNDNRCVLCHMPQTESGVPHTSTTNHRIAVYNDADGRRSTGGDAMMHGTPTEDRLRDPKQRSKVQVFPLQPTPEDMPDAELARLQALGTYWLYRKHMGGPHGPELAQMAGRAMQELVQSGQADAEVFANLAMLTYLQTQLVPAGPEREAIVSGMWQWAMEFAQQALRVEPRPTASRQTAMDVVGRYYYRLGQNREAASVFESLVQLRRRKEDWAMLGISLAQSGDSRRGESALRESIRINGGDPDLYESLSIIVGGSRPSEATRLDEIARRIRRVWTQSPENP